MKWKWIVSSNLPFVGSNWISPSPFPANCYIAQFNFFSHLLSFVIKFMSLSQEKMSLQTSHSLLVSKMLVFPVQCFSRCGYQFCYTCGAEWKNGKPTCSCPIWEERNIIRNVRRWWWLGCFCFDFGKRTAKCVVSANVAKICLERIVGDIN
jgi:hypothetical protein